MMAMVIAEVSVTSFATFRNAMDGTKDHGLMGMMANVRRTIRNTLDIQIYR